MNRGNSVLTKLDYIAYWLLILSGLCFFVLKEGACLHINDLIVPDVVKNGTASAVVLDCDYSLDSSDVGLVVKWFLNDGDTPVYQWIPPQRPQDLGKLKGKLNLQYRASNEMNKMHRALQILNPSPELSGEYTCTVSTYEQEASQSKKMVIYVPQSNIKFWHTVDLDDRDDNSVEEDDSSKEVESIVNVTCAAEGVYPEPTIRIYSESKLVSDKRHMKTKIRNGLFDVAASIQIDDDDMNMQDHEFECELSIPEANYTVKRAIYVSLENNLGTSWCLSTWLFFFTLILAVTAL